MVAAAVTRRTVAAHLHGNPPRYLGGHGSDRVAGRSTSVAELAYAAAGIDISCPFEIPFEIVATSGVEVLRRGIVVEHRVLRRTALPFSNFGMAIRKGEATCAVMIRCNNVLPGRGVRIIDEVAIVY